MAVLPVDPATLSAGVSVAQLLRLRFVTAARACSDGRAIAAGIQEALDVAFSPCRPSQYLAVVATFVCDIGHRLRVWDIKVFLHNIPANAVAAWRAGLLTAAGGVAIRPTSDRPSGLAALPNAQLVALCATGDVTLAGAAPSDWLHLLRLASPPGTPIHWAGAPGHHVGPDGDGVAAAAVGRQDGAGHPPPPFQDSIPTTE